MKWYPWLRPPFEALLSSYHSGCGHHALLVQALPGMGDDVLIYAMCRFLMCHQLSLSDRKKSCGKCHSCQLMQAGSHPDYYFMQSENGKNILGIDAVRAVMDKLYEYAKLGGEKVVWISDAAQLTAAAVDALLNILEEPPKNTWFFLACQEPARLLVTLRSRCRLYRLVPPDEAYGLAWLKREVTASQEAALTALRLAAGAPAAALAMLLQIEQQSARQQLCKALDLALRSGDWLPLLPIFNHDSVATRLYWLLVLLLDALKLQQGISLLTNVDALPLVRSLAQYLSSVTLQTIAADVVKCRVQMLSSIGCNRELTLCERLLRWEHWLQPGASLPLLHL